MKSTQEILDMLRPVLAEVFGVEKSTITMNTVPKDIEAWDSMGHIKMFAAIELELGINFGIMEISECESVADLIKLMKEKK